MRRYLLLGLWIVGIVFPMIWLTDLSPAFTRLFNILFEPAWVHVVMHTLLFGVLAYLLFLLAQESAAPSRGRTAVLVIGVVLLVALLQEGFQLLYLGRAPGANEVFDLGVDLNGGLFGLLFGWRFVHDTRRSS